MSLQPRLDGVAADVFGGSFVGNLITAICFGAVSVQAMVYFATFPKDPLYTRLTVLFLWYVVQAFQVACVTESLWYYFIASYRNPFALLNGNWELSIYQLSSVLQSGTVQAFFAYRVYQLSNSWAFGITVGLFALVQFVFGMIVSVKANIILSFLEIVAQIRWLVTLWLGIQSAADMVIALSMVYLLQQRRTGFKTTDSMLNLMTVWTVNTGLLTAIISIVVLIFFALYGFHFVVLSLGLPMGGFYSFTMLANLHSRSHIAERIHRSRGTGEPPQAWQLNNMSRSRLTEEVNAKSANSVIRSFGRMPTPHTPIVIGVAREEHQVIEEDETTPGSQYYYQSTRHWAPQAR
ncbi:hypothetical protein DL93DRAFT_2074274 [Clavulina sp. PMI_390]|nr:hypothetical protein DL93DRAFT_2074274 [Clavulina sp. PMI_390]